MDFLFLEFQAQLGVRPTGLGGLVDGVAGQAAARQKRRAGVVTAQVGAHQRRVCIGVAVFAQMAAGVIGADIYLLLVRWKGFLRLRSRYETVHRTVSPKFVARGARQIWSLLSGVRIHCARHKNNRQISKDIYLLLVRWKGFEPPTFWFVAEVISLF